MQSVTHALFDVGLQGVVSRDSSSGITLRLRRITDVGHAQVHVTAFEGGEERTCAGVRRRADSVAGQIDRGTGHILNAAHGALHGVAVGVLLRVEGAGVDGVGRRGDSRLVKWDGNHFVAAQVADVSDFDGEIVTRLPLDVERVIDGVGELVGTVISGKREERLAVDNGCFVGQVLIDACWIATGSRPEGRSPGVGKWVNRTRGASGYVPQVQV